MRKVTRYARETFAGKGGLLRFFNALDDEFTELHRKLDTSLLHRSHFERDILIRTTGTTITHRLGRLPVAVRVLPKADARVWEQSRSSTQVVLKASADVKAEVEVKG